MTEPLFNFYDRDVTFIDIMSALDTSIAAGEHLGDAVAIVRKQNFDLLLNDLTTLRKLLPPPNCARCRKTCAHCAAEPGPPTCGDGEIQLYHQHGVLTIRGTP